MDLTKTDFRVIRQALEWCVEDTTEDTITGKTTTNKIKRVLNKLKGADLKEKTK